MKNSQRSPRIRFTELRSSIFDSVAEAKVRAGVNGNKPSSTTTLKRGRNDRDDWVITTTMFNAALPADVPVRGVIELGIRKRTLRTALNKWKKRKRKQGTVTVSGHFLVNEVRCQGTLAASFAGKLKPEFSYTALQ